MVGKAEAKGHEVGVDYKEVCKIFLDSTNNLMVVCFSKALEGGFLDNVAKVCWCQQLPLGLSPA